MEGFRTQSIVEWTVSVELRMASRESLALSDESLLSLSVALWLCENQKMREQSQARTSRFF